MVNICNELHSGCETKNRVKLYTEAVQLIGRIIRDELQAEDDSHHVDAIRLMSLVNADIVDAVCESLLDTV